MSGGSWERVAGYVNNGHENLTIQVKVLLEAPGKYKNVYEALTSSGTTATTGNDNQQKNYESTEKIFGDAIYEVSNNYTGPNVWNNNYGVFPYSENPLIGRGGGYSGESGAGMFYFSSAGDAAHNGYSFRPSIVVY